MFALVFGLFRLIKPALGSTLNGLDIFIWTLYELFSLRDAQKALN